MKTMQGNLGFEILPSGSLASNPLIHKVMIKIASAGEANKTYLSREVLSDAATRTLGLTPIVAYYNIYKEDFGEHGEQVETGVYGEYIRVVDTRAIGVIPENPEIFWDEDGYLTTYGYLWTYRYPEGFKVLEGGKGQSMELAMEHSEFYFDKEHDRHIITKTAFEALCILGDDVQPAFHEARVEAAYYQDKALHFSEKDMKKEVNTFMEELRFALNHNFDDSNLVVDVDGEERDKKHREKVTEAIDYLDVVADHMEADKKRDMVDEAISKLVEVELGMKKEAAVLPANDLAEKALNGFPDRNEGIVGAEFKEKEDEKSMAFEDKKKKDEEVVEPKEETKETPVVEEKVQEEESIEEAETVEETEEESTPSEDTTSGDGIEEGTGEVAEPEEEAEGTGEPVSGESSEEISEDIADKRVDAEAKRASALVSDLSDVDLLAMLTERIENNEAMRSALQKYMGDNVAPIDSSAELAQSELEVKVEEIETEDGVHANPADLASMNEDVEENIEGEGETVENEAVEESTDEEAPVAEEASEEAPVEEESEEAEEDKAEDEAPVEESKEEAPSEEDEDDKKKKDGKFSIKEVVAENITLAKENENLKSQVEELLQYKLIVEEDKKQKVLDGFDISDSAKEEIRVQFSQLSEEDIEAKAAIAFYKEQRGGQKQTNPVLEFLSLEEDTATISQETTLEDFLKSFE